MLSQLLFCLTPLPALGYSLDLSPRQQDKDPFRRRALQSVTILGNYLYIEGGEISNYYNGERAEDVGAASGLTSTQTIRLDQSWSNDSVEINIIQKKTPEIAKIPVLWADEESNTLYRWGGRRPGDGKTGEDEATLWAFTPDSEGGGSWSSQPPSNPSVFEDIIAGSAGAFGVCGRTGITAGGLAFEATDARLEDNVTPLPGLLTYDFGTRAWANESTVPINSPDGTFIVSSGVCVPELVSDPLFFVLGGSTTSPVTIQESELRSFRNITFFNPATSTWHWQEAKGDVPSGRDQQCAVGVQGQNGTYEIFVYGGKHPVDGILNDIYVLSIPGFEWFRVDVQSTPRHAHACTTVGKRQMLVTGGLGDLGDWKEQDTWQHGLGVFDMSTLEWSSGYDADAADYETPQMIQDWYNEGGLDSVSWNDDAVESMFSEIEGSGDPSGGDSGSDPPPPSDGGSGSGSDPDTSEDSGTPVGAIAGGVVGGVAGIALIGGLIFFFLRRRRSQEASDPIELTGDDKDKPPPSYGGSPYGQPQYVAAAELDQHPQRHYAELSPDTRSELASEPSRPVEVPG